MTSVLQAEITVQAERRPEAPAVASAQGGPDLTYGELETASNRLARLLRDAGCGRGDRVCLLAPKSPAVVIALLGVLKADAVWVPLDPASPPARLRKVLAACAGRWILAGGTTAGLLDSLFADPEIAAMHAVGWLTPEAPVGRHFRPAFTAADLAGYSAAPRDYEAGAHDSAHILFTSGSTGVPKGVVITHANVLHFVRWARRYCGTAPSDRISWHPPLHFDLSTFDLFGTLGAGACLYPVPAELSLLPHRLVAFIRSAALTQWFSVPSVLSYVASFDALPADALPALRRVLWCGEVLPTPALIYWMRRVRHARFTNLYGPTETTIASSYYPLREVPDDPRGDVPIGRPCPGEELYVLDAALAPVPPGEVGELYIGGAGLSPGYWRDAEKTREAFVPHPFSTRPGDRLYRTGDLARLGPHGLVYYVGRADTQIKSRGYRIELGEIEAALHSLGLLRECAVLAVPSEGFDGTTICCAFACGDAGPVQPAALKQALGDLLPAYMLPSRWLACETLPRNANGKVDRRELRERFVLHVAQAP